MNIPNQKPLYGTIFLVSLLITANGFSAENLPSKTIVLTMKTINENYEASGTVKPLQEADVMAQTSGLFLSVNASEGDTVEGGAVLATIEDHQLTLSLSQAEYSVIAAQAGKRQAEQNHLGALALLNQSKLEFDRVQKMHSGKAATNQQMEQAEAAFQQAQAASQSTAEAIKASKATVERALDGVKQVKVSLGYAKVTSPFKGTITHKYVNTGDLAWPGRPVYRIINDTTMRIEANVRESLAGILKKGQILKAKVDATNLETEGVLTEIVPSSDPQSRTFRIKVDLRNSSQLLSGMFGRIEIPTGTRECLIVPEEYISRIGQLQMVHVKEKNIIKRRLIRTGAKTDNGFIVTSGLSSGEELVQVKRGK